MINWEELQKDLIEKYPHSKDDFEEMSLLAKIITAIINRRKELGLSQRDLAKICGLPHSSVARIESCFVRPNIDTLIKIMKPLGLTLSVVSL